MNDMERERDRLRMVNAALEARIAALEALQRDTYNAHCVDCNPERDGFPCHNWHTQDGCSVRRRMGELGLGA